MVDPLETLVQFGLRISPGGPKQSEISLYHTHPEDRFVSKVNNTNSLFTFSLLTRLCVLFKHFPPQVLAKFLVPSFAKKWTRFAFRVLDSGLGVPNVTLFFNCIEYGSIVISSVPWKEQLTFDTASTLYIGQAGGLILPPGEFVVRYIFFFFFPLFCLILPSNMTDASRGEYLDSFRRHDNIRIEKHCLPPFIAPVTATRWREPFSGKKN